MTEEDEIGVPIWPAQLRLTLGTQYLNLDQLAQKSGITEEQAQLVAQALTDTGNLQPWYAPECPECKAIWPGFMDEDDIPKVIYCPHCHTTTPSEFVDIYIVFEIIKLPGS